MRTMIAALVGAWVSIAPTSAPEGPAWDLVSDAPTVSVFPERPVQGHLFRVRVAPSPGQPLAAVRGEAGGEVLRFAVDESGVYEAFGPAPIDTEGSLRVQLVAVDEGGGEEPITIDLEVVPGEYRHERLSVAPRLGGRLNDADAARLAEDQAKAAAVARQAHATPRLWTDERVMPREDRVTSGFGNGRIFNDEVSSRHMGLDLDGDPGDVVVAPSRGVVALVDSFLLAGNIVYLNHGGGLLSGYFHLSEALVAEGDTVAAGTPIGRVGATGRVTGPHLHWVVRVGTTSVDPRSWMTMPPAEGSGAGDD
ncbi:MAG: M23 family metallopeptidase [Gemmatimonadetes bacterium]|nr:M23 family metallopeptidase [Gemmatimonadota bacterium]